MAVQRRQAAGEAEKLVQAGAVGARAGAELAARVELAALMGDLPAAVRGAAGAWVEMAS